MVAIQLERQNKWHLHLKAVGWYMHDFSVGSLSHMSQNKPPTLSTLSILRQLELLSNNKRVYRQLFRGRVYTIYIPINRKRNEISPIHLNIHMYTMTLKDVR